MNATWKKTNKIFFNDEGYYWHKRKIHCAQENNGYRNMSEEKV